MREVWIDISGFQKRPPPEWFDSLRALGVVGVWVQLYGGQPGFFSVGVNVDAEYQLAQARRAGLKTAGYVWLPPQGDPYFIAGQAKGITGPQFQYLLFGSLDIEGNYAHGDTRLTRAYAALHDIFLPRPVSVYTNKTQWQYQHDTTVLSAAPLHEAWYTTTMQAPQWYKQHFDAYRQWSLPFGGWTQRAAWQFFGGEANGVGADWNIIDTERLNIKEETAMSVFDKTVAEVLPAAHPFRQTWPDRDGNNMGYEIANILCYLDAVHLAALLDDETNLGDKLNTILTTVQHTQADLTVVDTALLVAELKRRFPL